MRTYAVLARRLSALKDLPLLLMRLVLAYGFYLPAKMKWSDIHGIGDWFGTLHIPLPYVSAYLVGTHISSRRHPADPWIVCPLYYPAAYF